MTLIAHGGNLLVDLPLYGLPVLAVILALAVSTARSRRSRSRTQTPSRRRQSR
jgi:cytochrome c-type biogenesis protein CcmH/NrfF